MIEKPKTYWASLQFMYKKLLAEGVNWQLALKKAARYANENFIHS